ncbi:MAG TPA: ABC transporter ATP-binding protein [Cyclobacteriaceae bacterium]|nr:ABC transporter ATP-binding protein [Cyclobacteriaceae bacterium]HMV09666.1 ABC transporter ATP-binding protein [Cyclobacteriaceae bacterium]HMV89429.1 ABC transporter ATP-binding protein [Cyclobacteriaceae bacterium]HMX02219.1 ABC transporter ATP-binding protein [Cyclobacteriaceae bacterium]HMX51240.1 ABC transporter ATP-binding protein [Cyclobacteriaceae bacterium]
MSQEILLQSKNLSVGYAEGDQRNVLFEHVDLELRAGELVCFMGANGIGKSSLIRTLAGLQKPLLSDKQSTDPTKVSVVLTDRVNAVNMTVTELVTLGRYPYLDWNIKLTNEDKLIINSAIRDTHIESLRDKKLYELSDGQLQMAMIARALAQDTPVILLDEPTAHLDLNNRVEIMNLLRRLARSSNKAILVATHELDLALQTADLIWLAGGDKKLIIGIPEDLVLNGSFDVIFQFKGFDLKTGKVFHEAWRNHTVNLIGDGYEYLWTKNALERNGFIVDKESPITISIQSRENLIEWIIGNEQYRTLEELIRKLQ